MALVEGTHKAIFNRQHPGLGPGLDAFSQQGLVDQAILVGSPIPKKRWFRPVLEDNPRQAAEVKTSTELLKDVIRHVDHRSQRQLDSDDLTQVQYVRGLLEAISRQKTQEQNKSTRDMDVVERLFSTYGEKSYQLAHVARALLEGVAARSADIATKTNKLTPAEQLVVIGEAAKIQKRLEKKAGVDLSSFDEYKLPEDKVRQAKKQEIKSIAGNIASNVFSLGVGWATKDYNWFDFQNRAASITTAVITYIPLAAGLIAYGRENLKQLREKGINLVYWSKKRHERSILKGKSTQDQEKAANRGYYEQEGGIEVAIGGLSVINESFTMWGMSNIVATGIAGAKIVASKCYRLGVKEGLREGLVEPAVKIAKLPRKLVTIFKKEKPFVEIPSQREKPLN